MQAAQILNSPSTQPIDWISLARRGVSKQLMLSVQDQLELSQKEMATLLHLTPRTMQRMKDEQLMLPASCWSYCDSTAGPSRYSVMPPGPGGGCEPRSPLSTTCLLLAYWIHPQASSGCLTSWAALSTVFSRNASLPLSPSQVRAVAGWPGSRPLRGTLELSWPSGGLHRRASFVSGARVSGKQPFTLRRLAHHYP